MKSNNFNKIIKKIITEQDYYNMDNESQKINIDYNKFKTKIENQKTKQSIKNNIYRFIQPFTSGIFRDQGWGNVRKVWEMLELLDFQVQVWCQNGGYYHNQKMNTHGKQYNFKLTHKTKDIEFSGKLICSFTNFSNEGYDSPYDMIFILG